MKPPHCICQGSVTTMTSLLFLSYGTEEHHALKWKVLRGTWKYNKNLWPSNDDNVKILWVSGEFSIILKEKKKNVCQELLSELTTHTQEKKSRLIKQSYSVQVSALTARIFLEFLVYVQLPHQRLMLYPSKTSSIIHTHNQICRYYI